VLILKIVYYDVQYLRTKAPNRRPLNAMSPRSDLIRNDYVSHVARRVCVCVCLFYLSVWALGILCIGTIILEAISRSHYLKKEKKKLK